MLSNYSSDDYCISNDDSKSDGEDDCETEYTHDPMSAYLNINMYEASEEAHESLQLEKSILFKNVDKFREVLRDYAPLKRDLT